MKRAYTPYSHKASYNVENLIATNMRAIYEHLKDLTIPPSVRVSRNERSVIYQGRDQTIKIDCYNTVTCDVHPRRRGVLDISKVKSIKSPFTNHGDACLFVKEQVKGMYESRKTQSGEATAEAEKTEA